MARPLRIEYEGAFYHVTSRGDQRGRIFWDDRDREEFLKVLGRTKERYGYLLHAYVLMGNHHLLVETPHSNLKQIMQNVNTSYTVYVNRRHRRSGHLFQGRYKAFSVDKEGYLLELGRYIQLNPVRAGLVRRPEDYRWSSYREYMDGRRQGGLTDREDTLGFFSKKWALAVRKYRDFVKEGIKRGSPLEEAVGSVLGDEGFKRRVMGYLKGLSNVGEIPDLRRVIVKPKVEEIIAKASEFYRVSKEDLLRRRKSTGRERSVTIYLCKVLSGRKNSEIGKFFGIAIQAVTNAVRKMERLRQVEKKLAKEVDSIKEMLIIQSV